MRGLTVASGAVVSLLGDMPGSRGARGGLPASCGEGGAGHVQVEHDGLASPGPRGQNIEVRVSHS